MCHGGGAWEGLCLRHLIWVPFSRGLDSWTNDCLGALRQSSCLRCCEQSAPSCGHAAAAGCTGGSAARLHATQGQLEQAHNSCYIPRIAQVYSQRMHDSVRDLLALGRPQIDKPAAPLKHLTWFPAADAQELQVERRGWGGQPGPPPARLLGY